MLFKMKQRKSDKKIWNTLIWVQTRACSEGFYTKIYAKKARLVKSFWGGSIVRLDLFLVQV